eukprot:210245_1
MVDSWGVKTIFMLEDYGLNVHGTGVLTSLNQPADHLMLTSLCYNPADISNGRRIFEAIFEGHRDEESLSDFEICVELASENSEIQSVAVDFGFSRIRESEDGWTLFALRPSKTSNPVETIISPKVPESPTSSSSSLGLECDGQSSYQELLKKMQRDFNAEVTHYTRFRKRRQRTTTETIDVCSDENMSDVSPENDVSSDKPKESIQNSKPATVNTSQYSIRPSRRKPSQSCKICPKFKTKSGLERHRRLHKDESVKFEKKLSRATNFMIHRPKKFKCSECGKKFIRNEHMLSHSRIHSKRKMLECSKCNKKFNFKINLEIHLRQHNGQVIHECEICQKKFALKSAIRNHRASHSKEKPFSCNECGKAFSLKCNMNAHWRKTHAV